MNESFSWAKETHQRVNQMNDIRKGKGKENSMYNFNADTVSNRKYCKNYASPSI